MMMLGHAGVEVVGALRPIGGVLRHLRRGGGVGELVELRGGGEDQAAAA